MAWVIEVIGLTIDLATKAMAATLSTKQVINPIASESISRLVASDNSSTIEYDSAEIALRVLRMLASMPVKLSSVWPSIIVAIGGSVRPTSSTSLAVLSYFCSFP